MATKNNANSSSTTRSVEWFKGKLNNHLESFPYSIYVWALDLSYLLLHTWNLLAHYYQVASCLGKRLPSNPYFPVKISFKIPLHSSHIFPLDSIGSLLNHISEIRRVCFMNLSSGDDLLFKQISYYPFDIATSNIYIYISVLARNLTLDIRFIRYRIVYYDYDHYN